ncbi:MAG: hypothetical protein ACLPY5_10195 [Candidatus Bathyarchaeia archaeon]
MTSKAIISILLLVAIFIPFLSAPNANSQTGAASFTVVTVSTPPSYQCSLLPLAFSAQRSQLIQGYFTADVTIDIYVLSQNDFNAFVQGNTCTLPQSAYPLFMQTQVVGSNNAYSATIPTNGTYYILFVYRNNGISQITSGYATIDLSYPPFITLTQVSTSATATTFTSSNSSMLSVSTPVPEFPVWGTAIPLILSITLAAAIIRRKRK